MSEASKRDAYLTVTMRPEDLQKVKEVAALERMSASTWAWRVLMEKVISRKSKRGRV